MSLIIISVLVLALAGRAAHSAWRLWSLLPKRNADFGLVEADLGGRP